MVDKRDCSFCGSAIEPGTGMLFIKRDGTRHQFCSSKCRRNLLDLKRVPRTVKWTKHYVKGLGKASAVQGKAQAVAKSAPAPKPAAPKPLAATATTGGGASEAASKPEAPKAAAKKAGESPKGGKTTKGSE